jgi:hypothetical protein
VQRPSDPARAAVAVDKDVARLAKAADKAREAYERADAEWIDSVRAEHAAMFTARSAPVAITHDGRPLTANGSAWFDKRAREIGWLQERTAELRFERERAWARCVRARDEDDRAAGSARRRFEQLADIAAAVSAETFRAS